MEIEVMEERENPLLERKELWLKLRFEGSVPQRKEVRDKIAALKACDQNLVVVQWIRPVFGAREAKCFVKIYNSKEAMLSVEPKHIIRRNFGGEGGEEEKGKKE